MTAELREFRRLSIVAQSHVGFERSFVTEQLVFVSFVWTNGEVDGRVEIHPGDVAVVVIVGTERSGALVEKIFERGVSGQRACFFQQRRGGREIFLVSLAVGNDCQFLIWSTSNQVEEAGGLLFVRVGETLNPRI